MKIKWMIKDRVELYLFFPPLGRSIPVEVTPFPVEDSISGEAEIADAITHLCLNCLLGPLGMWVDHLLQWLQEATR